MEGEGSGFWIILKQARNSSAAGALDSQFYSRLTVTPPTAC